MTTYSPPIRDMQFVINDVLQISRFSNLPGFADATEDMISAILEEGGKLAANVLHPINHSGDQEGCTRHDDGSVPWAVRRRPAGVDSPGAISVHAIRP